MVSQGQNHHKGQNHKGQNHKGQNHKGQKSHAPKTSEKARGKPGTESS